MQQVKDLIHEAEQKLNAAQKSNQPIAIITALRDCAAIYAHYGQFQDAIALLEKALPLSNQHQDAIEHAYLMGSLGECLLKAGFLEKAHECIMRQQAIGQQHNNPHIEKLVQGNLGLYYAKKCAPKEALVCINKGIILSHDTGDYEYEALLNWAAAAQYRVLKNTKEAIGYGTKAVAIFNELGDPRAQVLYEQLMEFDSGLIAKMSTLVKSSVSHLKAINENPLSKAERDKRLSVCKQCEYHTGITCNICGCFTAVKSWLPYAQCPIRKWPGDQ